ncbi:hypothetical protein [Alloalcanivorax marinus]|uniref:hypothetical protein n=1 Tax=Alloalcanivorax marinus TaxID=1177169 RepID=UPI0019330679|nr:hypothetical protein [Alloalcanivorax marinus]MBL7251870.1 hypothetical protein [Alloalcanivorax marinus]
MSPYQRQRHVLAALQQLGTSASLPEILQCLPEGFAECSVRWLAGLGVTREEYQRRRDRQTEPPSP